MASRRIPCNETFWTQLFQFHLKKSGYAQALAEEFDVTVQYVEDDHRVRFIVAFGALVPLILCVYIAMDKRVRNQVFYDCESLHIEP